MATTTTTTTTSSSHHEAKYATDVIGNWGPMQRTIMIVLALGYMAAPFGSTVLLLYAPKIAFYCNHINQSSGELVVTKSACDYPISGFVTVQHSNTTTQQLTEKCTNFTYDHSFYRRTLVDQFDLVCDRSWYASLSQSCHQLGYAVSGLVLGFISDRFGRILVLKSAIFGEIVAGFGLAFSGNIWCFCAARFVIGISSYGRFLSAYVLLTEWIGSGFRARAIIAYESGWHAGYAVMLSSFFLIPDFRIIQSLASTAEIVSLIIHMIFVLESPKWLLMHGKHEEAEQILTKAASAKGKLSAAERKQKIANIITKSSIRELGEDVNAAKQTIVDVWKIPILLRLSLCLYFTWFAHGIVGYGSLFNTVNLGGDYYTNLAIFSANDFLILFLIYGIINCLPRKKTLICGLICEIVALIGVGIASMDPSSLLYLQIASSLLFRSSLSLMIHVYYLYTAESFPTAMRQASIGTCSLFARFGSILAPFAREVTKMTGMVAAQAIFASILIINLLLVLMMPEIGRTQLPDTISQKKKQMMKQEYHEDDDDDDEMDGQTTANFHSSKKSISMSSGIEL